MNLVYLPSTTFAPRMEPLIAKCVIQLKPKYNTTLKILLLTLITSKRRYKTFEVQAWSFISFRFVQYTWFNSTYTWRRSKDGDINSSVFESLFFDSEFLISTTQEIDGHQNERKDFPDMSNMENKIIFSPYCTSCTSLWSACRGDVSKRHVLLEVLTT